MAKAIAAPARYTNHTLRSLAGGQETAVLVPVVVDNVEVELPVVGVLPEVADVAVAIRVRPDGATNRAEHLLRHCCSYTRTSCIILRGLSPSAQHQVFKVYKDMKSALPADVSVGILAYLMS